MATYLCTRSRLLVLTAIAAVAGACTINDTKTPPLTGPSAVTLAPNVTPNFTFSPAAPIELQPVFFDARSTADPAGVVTGYSWDFGNGQTTTGPTASQAFSTAGLFTVKLTVTDTLGRAITYSQPVTIGAGQPPVAAFTVSPTNPAVNEPVQFNASASRPAENRTIQSYEWAFGDGSTASGMTASRSYSQAGGFNVVLTVKDNAGKIGTASQSVTVGAGAVPTPVIAFSPNDPMPGTRVFFDASESTAPPGRTIVEYHWNLGDGNIQTTGVRTDHVYTAIGNYEVLLTVVDNTGARATFRRVVPVTIPS
jgi:large repetitive protein